VVAALEPGVPTMVAGRGMRPASVLRALELMATIIVARPEVAATIVVARPEVVAIIIVARTEMPHLTVRPVLPPRPRRIVLEPRGPGLRSEVSARRMSMMPELRAVTQDDAEIERGHHIWVDRGMPVGGCRRRSSPKVFSTMIEPASRHLNGA
jgi:hypothetical protein